MVSNTRARHFCSMYCCCRFFPQQVLLQQLLLKQVFWQQVLLQKVLLQQMCRSRYSWGRFFDRRMHCRQFGSVHGGDMRFVQFYKLDLFMFAICISCLSSIFHVSVFVCSIKQAIQSKDTFCPTHYVHIMFYFIIQINKQFFCCVCAWFKQYQCSNKSKL